MPEFDIELEQIAPHVVHGARELADFRRSGRRDGSGEVALAEAQGRIGQCLGRLGHPPTQQHAGDHGQHREHHGSQDEAPHRAPEGARVKGAVKKGY